MKKTRRDYVKIALTIAIIAGLFMPYVSEILPIDVIWEWERDWEFLFALPIPILVVIPLLILLIFKNSFRDSILKPLKIIFLIIYINVFADYCYGLYSDFGSSFLDISLEFLVSIPLSLVLFLLSLKYSITKLVVLQHLLMATMALPIFLYFVYGLKNIDDTNYGFYVLNGSFITLYAVAVYNIFKNRNIKNEVKNKEIIT